MMDMYIALPVGYKLAAMLIPVLACMIGVTIGVAAVNGHASVEEASKEEK